MIAIKIAYWLIFYLVGALINFWIMDYVVRKVSNYNGSHDKSMVFRFTILSWITFIVIVIITLQALNEYRDKQNKT